MTRMPPTVLLQILAKVEADIDDELAGLRITMDDVQDITKRSGQLRRRGTDVEVVKETGGLKMAFQNVSSINLMFDDIRTQAGGSGGPGGLARRLVGGGGVGGVGGPIGMSSCELAHQLMAAVPPGGYRPLLIFIHSFAYIK